jgi:hypothetical protein
LEAVHKAKSATGFGFCVLTGSQGALQIWRGSSRGEGTTMSFCEHCEGQRFDRAQVLRVLRAARKTLPKHRRADEALRMAIKAVRALEIPHLEHIVEPFDEQIVH